MKIEDVKKLTVKYNDRTVGYLAELKNGKIAFQYDDEWIKNGFSISPFSLPLSKEIFVNNNSGKFDGLFGVFWDSLPDGWGELLVRRMLNKHGINFDRLSPLQKLSIINKNGLGALEYEPNRNLQVANKDYNLDQIAKEAEKILNDDTENVNLDNIFNLGGSSGGARPKAHITFNNEEWIVKFPCQIDPKDIGEREYRANKLAKDCGINVNECKLFDSKICSGFFGAKRFDRENNQKVHMISLSALLETTHRVPNLDYGHLFQVIQNICADKEDIYEAFKRMCFNVFYENKDDHGKNFSFLFDETIGGYKLSPAYDLTSLPNKLEHEMMVNGNGKPTEKDLLKLAKTFKLSTKKCRDIIKNTEEILEGEKSNCGE